MAVVDDDVVVELLDDHVRAPLELGAVLPGPPVAQASRGVEPRARVVEAVRDLVADDRPDAAVVDGVVRVGPEHRRLEDPGREHDLVVQRVVVGVDGRGRASPTRSVSIGSPRRASCRRTSKVDAARRLPTNDVRSSSRRGVVAPPRRIADLEGELRVLGERLPSRRLGHPGGVSDRPLHRREQVPHQLLAAGLGMGRERRVHVQPRDGVADVGARRAEDALPARLLLLLAAERPAVEGERLVLECGRQGGRAGTDEVPAEHVAKDPGRRLRDRRVELTKNPACSIETVGAATPSSPTNLPSARAGHQPVEVGDPVAVHREPWIAPLLRGERRLGQPALEGQDRIRRRLGLVASRAQVAQLRRHVGRVGRPQRDRSLVVVEVVVAVGQAQPRLQEIDQVGVRVLEVRVELEREERSGAHAMEVERDRAHVVGRRNGLDPVEVRTQRRRCPPRRSRPRPCRPRSSRPPGVRRSPRRHLRRRRPRAGGAGAPGCARWVTWKEPQIGCSGGTGLAASQRRVHVVVEVLGGRDALVQGGSVDRAQVVGHVQRSLGWRRLGRTGLARAQGYVGPDAGRSPRSRGWWDAVLRFGDELIATGAHGPAT